MALLRSRSHRFSRNSNYMLQEYRPTAPQGQKDRISVVVPATHERRPDQRASRSDVKR